MRGLTDRAWLRLLLCSAALLLLLIGSVAIGLSCGAVHLSARVLAHELTGGRWGADPGVAVATIFWEFRLPRVLAAMVVGAALAAAGAALQALLRNPLADPYVLGTSSGAALASLIAMALGLGRLSQGPHLLPLVSFFGAIVASLLVYRIARRGTDLLNYSLILAGIIVTSLFSAVLVLIFFLAEPARTRSFLFWMMGDLSAPGEVLAPAAGLIMVGLALLLVRGRALNLLALGDETALSLGIEASVERRNVFLLAALLTGAAVATAGIIGFAGIIVPHALRLALGPDHRVLLPSSALAGAVLLILSDLLARSVVAPAELPVGVITALLGAPLFLFLLARGSGGEG